MLVLERKAAVEITPTGPREKIQAQPLGGGSRLMDPAALSRSIGAFNYDSLESAAESDFRIQINPSDWPKVKEFCLEHFMNSSTHVVESNPSRSLLHLPHQHFCRLPSEALQHRRHRSVDVRANLRHIERGVPEIPATERVITSTRHADYPEKIRWLPRRIDHLSGIRDADSDACMFLGEAILEQVIPDRMTDDIPPDRIDDVVVRLGMGARSVVRFTIVDDETLLADIDLTYVAVPYGKFPRRLRRS